MAKLVLSTGGAVVHQCFVDRERLTVGRESHNQIVIDDPAVSREHAAIVPIGNDHILEDLHSANGTLVNGTKLARRILQHGDVVEFGAFRLRYLNPKFASDIDLERTMLIAGLAVATPAATSAFGSVPMPAAETARMHFPRGRVWMGAGPRAGEVIELDRVVSMFGRTGVASAVIVRRPLGYYVSHVEGPRPPRVNGRSIGRDAWLLHHGDIVETGDERLEFTLDEQDRREGS